MGAESDWAWAAGLFEGEGSITLYDRYIMLAMTTTDRDVLERFVGVVGYGKVHTSLLRGGQRKQQYRWAMGQREMCIATLNRMLPWLGERRAARAIDAIAHAEAMALTRKSSKPLAPTLF